MSESRPVPKEELPFHEELIKAMNTEAEAINIELRRRRLLVYRGLFAAKFEEKSLLNDYAVLFQDEDVEEENIPSDKEKKRSIERNLKKLQKENIKLYELFEEYFNFYSEEDDEETAKKRKAGQIASVNEKLNLLAMAISTIEQGYAWAGHPGLDLGMSGALLTLAFGGALDIYRLSLDKKIEDDVAFISFVEAANRLASGTIAFCIQHGFWFHSAYLAPATAMPIVFYAVVLGMMAKEGYLYRSAKKEITRLESVVENDHKDLARAIKRYENPEDAFKDLEVQRLSLKIQDNQSRIITLKAQKKAHLKSLCLLTVLGLGSVTGFLCLSLFSVPSPLALAFAATALFTVLVMAGQYFAHKAKKEIAEGIKGNPNQKRIIGAAMEKEKSQEKSYVSLSEVPETPRSRSSSPPQEDSTSTSTSREHASLLEKKKGNGLENKFKKDARLFKSAFKTIKKEREIKKKEKKKNI